MIGSNIVEKCDVTSMGVNKLSNVRGFIVLLSGEGLTSFSINNRIYFFGEKKVKNEAFQGVFFLEHAQKL